ncbi:MAG TPA: hypothetical protein VJ746_08400 [Nitrospira sp.]|nr:hypothetical protein [Nitrospira sp.]
MSCERCGGFKVLDYFYGPLPCDGFRCVNCGAITDMRVVTPVQTRTEHLPKNRTKGGRRPLFVVSGPVTGHASETKHQP